MLQENVLKNVFGLKKQVNVPFYFLELPCYFPEVPFCFLGLSLCFPEVPFYFSKKFCFSELSFSVKFSIHAFLVFQKFLIYSVHLFPRMLFLQLNVVLVVLIRSA